MKFNNDITYSVISDLEIKDIIIKYYKFDSDKTSCVFYSKGLSDTYIINTEHQNFYFKIYGKGIKTPIDLKSEMKIMQILAQQGISTTIPVESKVGTSIEIEYSEGQRYAVLYPINMTDNHMTLERAYICGQKLALVHQIFDTNKVEMEKIPLNFHSIIDEPFDRIKDGHIATHGQVNRIKDIIEKLKYNINRLDIKDGPYWGIIHGDFNSSSIYFDRENNFSILNFDACSFGWRDYDLSTFYCKMFNWGRRFYLKKHFIWKNFLKGYNCVRKITDIEYKAINNFIPLCEIWNIGTKIKSKNKFGLESMYNDELKKRLYLIEKWVKKYNLV